MILASCASQPFGGPFAGQERGTYRVGEPYQVNGVWYYPVVDYNYDKTGIASWYGREFAGRYTANGEIFDPNRLTAANTTLPMPSIVQVTNLQNGRSLQLRINDRGPFVDGRLIDVSRRAAQLLGFEMRGTTPVEVKILKDASIEAAEEAMRGGAPDRVAIAVAPNASVVASVAPEPRAASAPDSRLAASVVAGPLVDPRVSASAGGQIIAPARDAELPPSPPKSPAGAAGGSGRLFVQAGAFAMQNNARRVQLRIASLGSVRVIAASVNGQEVYRVRLGPLASRDAADRLLRSVVSNGYPAARIVGD